jgi:hypothetical protein
VNKHKLLECLHYRVRLWPVAERRAPDGRWLPPIDDDWHVDAVDPRGIVRLTNTRCTGLFVILGHDRIHHFEYEPHRDWDGLKHGMLILETQLVLSRNNVDYLPRPRGRIH